MSAENLVIAERDGARATVWLNRPEKRNALNIPLLEALCDHISALTADPGVRVIVLRGKGPMFCAGLDLKEARDPEVAHASATLVARALETLYYAPQLTLAAVQGGAIAGGSGLMSACDLAIAESGAKFGYPEVHRGLVAGLVMTFLRRQLNERHARELLLLGELISAERALEIGLLTRVVPPETLDDDAAAIARQALQGGPEAIQRTKEFFDRLSPAAVRDDLAKALELHVAVRSGGEAAEGMAAFAEKREPAWRTP